MSGLLKRKVVVPVDFSPESLKAVDTALEIVEDPSTVHVVHILPEISVTDPGVIWQTIDNENRRSHAQQALREWLADAKYKDVVIEIDFGDAGFRIAEYAKQIAADLIVTPSHGRRGIERLLIGSVAERVIRLAPCPVLVLRS